jgi:hypothetical protein
MVFELKVLKIFGPKGEEVAGENCIIRIFIINTSCQILLQ